MAVPPFSAKGLSTGGMAKALPSSKTPTKSQGLIGTPMGQDSDFRRVGILAKKALDITGVVWQERRVGLEDTRIVYAKADDPKRLILDYINLADMVECEQKEDEDDPSLTEIIFRTLEESRNGGRSYIFRCATKEAHEWEEQVDEAVEKAQEARHEAEMQEKYGHNCFAMQRARCNLLFHSLFWQFLVAFIIIIAFMVDVLEVQVLPKPGTTEFDVFFWLHLVITVFFTLELLFNIFVHSSGCFRE
jgi:hypothetical protein